MRLPLLKLIKGTTGYTAGRSGAVGCMISLRDGVSGPYAYEHKTLCCRMGEMPPPRTCHLICHKEYRQMSMVVAGYPGLGLYDVVMVLSVPKLGNIIAKVHY